MDFSCLHLFLRNINHKSLKIYQRGKRKEMFEKKYPLIPIQEIPILKDADAEEDTQLKKRANKRQIMKRIPLPPRHVSIVSTIYIFILPEDADNEYRT